MERDVKPIREANSHPKNRVNKAWHNRHKSKHIHEGCLVFQHKSLCYNLVSFKLNACFQSVLDNVEWFCKKPGF